MKATLHHSWQRVRAGAGAAVRFLQNGAANLAFPPCCVSCDVELCEPPSSSDPRFCDDCLDQMEFFRGQACQLCGAPIPLAPPLEVAGHVPVRKMPGCYRCRGRKLWFDGTVALGLYGGRLKEVLLRMKQAEGDALSLAMGRLFWQLRCDQLTALAADVVVPIPLHWRRRVAHRTNSAALLAEVLSTQLRVPKADGLLRRNRSTQKQFDLTPSKRWDNVRKAFAVRAGHHLSDAHVLLCDDILTTGATCSEAARTLRAAGAARVTVVVIARAFGNL